MVVVLIHWRIKPTEEAEAAFSDFWKNEAKIDDKSSLAAEFLSAPVPAREVPFRVDDLTLGHGVLDCKHFVNVGIWETWDAFLRTGREIHGRRCTNEAIRGGPSDTNGASPTAVTSWQLVTSVGGDLPMRRVRSNNALDFAPASRRRTSAPLRGAAAG